MADIDSTARDTARLLRPYQAKLVKEVLASLAAGNATLGVAPTGSGKGEMGAWIASRFKRVVVVAHRLEILDQWRSALKGHPNAWIGSVASALRHGPKRCDLLTIDEAHRSAAKTYLEIINKYGKARRVGWTATPLRTDGRGLRDTFDSIIEGPGIVDLVRAGYLVPYRALEAPDEALKQLGWMKRIAGDYSKKELSELMNQPRLVGDVVREYQKHARGKKTVVFAVSVEHSKALAREFTKSGVRAIHLDGHSSSAARAEGLARLASGDIDVLCSVNLFTEGWDCPAVSCVIMARPTASLTLYLQSVGRGMRPCDGKERLLILDHAGNMQRHGYPDAPRDWKLESDKEKGDRELEVLELERLHALGFDSIEAELEEKRILHKDSLSLNEIIKMLGRKKGSARMLLKEHGVRSIMRSGLGGGDRFLKSDISSLCEKLSDSYSAKECKVLLGTTDAYHILSKRGISRVSGDSTGVRYKKADIDLIIEELSTTYSTAECKKLLNSVDGSTTALERSGILPIFGPRSKSSRYSQLEIDNYIKSHTVDPVMAYSAKEAKALLKIKSNSHFSRLLAKYGIAAIFGTGGPTIRYPAEQIDKLVENRLSGAR